MADKNLGIRILGSLFEKETIAQINADLRKIESKIGKLDLGVDLKGITKELKQANIGKELSKAVTIDVNDIKKTNNQLYTEFKKLEKEFGGTIDRITKNSSFDENMKEDVKNYIATLRTAENVVKTIRLEPYVDGFRPALLSELDKSGEIARKQSEEQKKYADQYEQWWLKALNERSIKEAELREKTLKYEQETRNAIDKTLKSEKEKTEELEYQIEKEQKLARIKKQDLERRYGTILTQDQTAELDNYVNAMNRISKDTPNARREIDRIKTSFKEVESNIKSAGSRVNTFGENLEKPSVVFLSGYIYQFVQTLINSFNCWKLLTSKVEDNQQRSR